MTPIRSIKSLYALALTEGEGVGTAYEYFAKRLVLASWLRQIARPQHILVAGLPEKYGASLDFLLLAAELGAAVTVFDDRPSAIAKVQSALAAAQTQGWLVQVEPVCRVVDDLSEMMGDYDLCLSSEVLQRLTAGSRPAYVQRLQQIAPAVALFVPNADNPAHTDLSGLRGLHLRELELLGEGKAAEEQASPGPSRSRSRVDFTFSPRQPKVAHLVALSGYLDMPPFPPGIIRDEEQRARASSGRFEAVAMWALGYYARLEKFLPKNLRQNHSHIVYALTHRA